MNVVKNIHKSCHLPETAISSQLATDSFDYYHYGCDGQDDRGWGCGYRTLQSLCSWVRYQRLKDKQEVNNVPSLLQIQKALVTMQDKPSSFIGSKQWIGSVEVALVVDFFYDVPCKIIHIQSGDKIKDHLAELKEHFSRKGSPIMMGGDSDAASKAICGVCETNDGGHLLILDPHFYGESVDASTLMKEHYLLWRPVDSFVQSSFYNLCLPQLSGVANGVEKT